jgi:hypothetical protein
MAAAPLLSRPSAVAVLAGLAALLFGVWSVNLWRTRLLPARFAEVAGGVGAVVLFQATVLATAGDEATFTITVLGQAILLAATAHRVRRRGTLLTAAIYGAVGLLAALIKPLPLPLLIDIPDGHLDVSTLRGAVIVAALLVVASVIIAAAVVRLEVERPAIWWPLGIVGLYGFSGTVLCASMLVAPDQNGFLVGQVLVTVGWTACALVLLLKGIDTVPARMTGLALVAAALIKLIAFDLSTLDGIVRVAAFLGAGLVLLVAGVRYARAVSDRNTSATSDAP